MSLAFDNPGNNQKLRRRRTAIGAELSKAKKLVYNGYCTFYIFSVPRSVLFLDPPRVRKPKMVSEGARRLNHTAASSFPNKFGPLKPDKLVLAAFVSCEQKLTAQRQQGLASISNGAFSDKAHSD